MVRMVRRYAFLLFAALPAAAQTFPSDDPVIRKIWAEEMDSTQLPALAHQLFDVIGPRLVGSPGMMKAHEWAIAKYDSWGIRALNQQFGTWRSWERGVTHIDLIAPRVRTLEGTMLAFSPATRRGGVTARLIILADCPDSAAFQAWLPNVRGKFVLISQPQPTGRPDKNWEEFAVKESFDSLKALRERIRLNWEHRLTAACVKADSLPLVLEEAGAAGVISSLWSTGWGTYRVFDTRATKVPAVTLALEDYNLLYRLTENGDDPRVRIEAESKSLGPVPTYNTVATLPGTAVPGEYVMLSAHLDSWDASSGATDNGTGTIVMMEAMRVLRKCYPSPRRTIMAGHWGSEEQGLNGSRAFVLDHPEVVAHLQALFNQDNGTGRVQTMSGAGFIDAPERLAHWLSRLPHEVTQNIKMDFPGTPAGGGTDHASFDAAGAPGFGLGSLNWDYFGYTWHTNRDTYDKLVFDDLKNNVVLAACLAYCASEDTVSVSRLRRVMPADVKTGRPQEWPAVKEPKRAGGMNDLKEP
ncbi:MAG TPA: M28 family peptidase [Bacteroidota bacterium]|nr:M28 family peptidase [Bacteroidota bacterium]